MINVQPLCNNGLEMKTYGLSQLSTFPIHMKFWIPFLKKILYRELVLDRWNKRKHRFEIFIIKALTKI
jgi:hypothetical protein